jgi:aminopeptidase N
VTERPVPSLLRGFSAPVRLELPRDEDELAFLMGHDSDPFNRWDAAQTFAQRMILAMVADRAAGRPMALDERFVAAWGRILDDPALDGALKSLMLTPPDERVLGQAMDVVDVEGLHAAREHVRQALADAYAPVLLRCHEACDTGPYRLDPEAIAARRLRATTLSLLGARSSAEGRARAVALARAQLERADNMTDAEAALACLVDAGGQAREAALASFYARWKDEPLVIDKWFTVQATSCRPDTLQQVATLLSHPAFTIKNPNRVRALIGAFAHGNPARFHDPGGAGYAFLADRVIELDPLNPQVAARLVSALSRWRRYDAGRQRLMRTQLERIQAQAGLSRDVGEIIARSLA